MGMDELVALVANAPEICKLLAEETDIGQVMHGVHRP
jgi:hypothetical protein